MSGPKCGEVSISDRRQLEQERRRHEEEEERELEELEEKARRLERQQARLEERDRQRRERLRQKEQRRREREAERRRRAEELAEQARQAELVRYRQLRGQVEAAVGKRAELLSRFEGLRLPEPPDLSPPDLSSVVAVRRASDQLAGQAQAYQQQVDRSLMEHHRQAASARATDDMRAWSSAFRARATRTAREVVAALDAESRMVAGDQRRTRLAAMVLQARKLVEAVSGQGDGELSETTLGLLDEVLGAEDEAMGQVALARLRQAVAADLARLEQSRRETEARRQAKEQAEKQARKQEERRLVMEEIHDILEDMKYTVSGIQDTAFSQGGHLYAAHPDWPDHVLRFEFPAGSDRIRTVPLRIAERDRAKSLGEADERLLRRKDAEFDDSWCKVGGQLVEFKEVARKRGIHASFDRNHFPGELELGRIAEEAVGEEIRQARRETRETARLKSRVRQTP